MREIRIVTIVLFFILLQSCGNDSKKYKNYTKLEIQTEESINTLFEYKQIDLNKLMKIFENYFIEGKIINCNDPIEKQYYDILKFWEHPNKQFPIFKNKKKVQSIINKLGLKEKDVLKKIQLSSLTNRFIRNKSKINQKSTFYTFGSILETIKEIPNISPGLIAGTIVMCTNKNDLRKTLYQKAIMLLFCFDMVFFLY